MLNDHPARGLMAHDRGAHDPSDPTTSLVLDLLAWLEPGPRPYDEVMDRWRTHCPRLTVWEDAVDGGLVARTRSGSAPAVVEVTPLGHALLKETRRPV